MVLRNSLGLEIWDALTHLNRESSIINLLLFNFVPTVLLEPFIVNWPTSTSGESVCSFILCFKDDEPEENSLCFKFDE